MYEGLGFFNVVAFDTLSPKKRPYQFFRFLEVRSQVVTHRLRNLGDHLVQPLYFINKLRPGGNTPPQTQSQWGTESGLTPRPPNFSTLLTCSYTVIVLTWPRSLCPQPEKHPFAKLANSDLPFRPHLDVTPSRKPSLTFPEAGLDLSPPPCSIRRECLRAEAVGQEHTADLSVPHTPTIYCNTVGPSGPQGPGEVPAQDAREAVPRKGGPPPRRPGGSGQTSLPVAVCLGEFTMPLWSSITSSEKWAWLTLVLLSLLGGLIFSIRTRAPWCDKSVLIFGSNGRKTVNAESLTYMIHTHRGPGAGDVFLTHPPWGGRLQVWGCGAGAGLKAQISPFKGICWASTHSEEVWRDPGAGWCRPPLTGPHTQGRAPGFTHPSCHYDGNQGSFPTPSYKGSLQKGKQPA